jgi:nucleoside-diphosphate-sugar epimerase
MMKKAVITGVSGFIGSALAEYLVTQGVEVIGLDRVKPRISNTHIKFVPMELSNISECDPKELYGADIFYHLAWKSLSGEERGNVQVQLDNVKWTVDCLKFSKRIGCGRFAGAGSIMEKEAVAATTDRSAKPNMAYVYGGAKFAAHTMCMYVADDIGIDIVWPMITNAYGPGEISPRFINSTIRKIVNGDKLEFTLGEQNYDFVYITDVAKAMYLIGENGKSFNEYLIGSGLARPLKEFILEIKSIMNLAPERKFEFGAVPFTGSNLPLSAFDSSKTESDTGFKAAIGFTDGIRQVVKWGKGENL